MKRAQGSTGKRASVVHGRAHVDARFDARVVARFDVRVDDRLAVSNSASAVAWRRQTLARAAVAASLLCACLALDAFALDARQQPVPPGTEDVTPPPVKRVPDADLAQLTQAKDRKARLKLTIEMSERRLTNAATFTASEKFEDAADELGVYQALIEDVIKHLNQDGRANKSRDLFKRLELTLRAHVPRIETIRRLTPSEDAVHVKACIEFVREARTLALEAFYSDTVLRERPQKKGGDGSAHTTPPDKQPERKPDEP
ncbi:MAG TPA: hypothetical protein VFX96_13395 [Pyrinomonadaceae bacterium]|nr:hypothetical protein [Pyrinomonadaceae bacterium]